MTFLMLAWGFLKKVPAWVYLLILTLGALWFYGHQQRQVGWDERDVLCKAEAVAELKKAFAAAEKSRVEWAEKLAKREAEIGKFKAGLDAQAETFKAELASSERVAQKLSKELYDYVRIHPMGADCTLSPELQRLRSEQIREANERPNRPAG